LSKGTLREFWTRHPDAQGPLQAWYNEVKRAEWALPADISKRYPTASILGNDRVVFRIKGDAYRLIIRVFYSGRQVYIRFIGTHAEYNRINAEEV
jgi:mRNA interferase HigB